MSVWRATTTGDGRTYYYKPGTTEVTWEKPSDYNDNAPPPTPGPSADVDASWNEAKTAEGRPYYWNTVTKQTVWEAPEAFLKQQQQAPRSAREAPAFVAGSNNDFGSDDRGSSDRRMVGRGDRDHGLPSKPSFDGGRDGGRGGGGPWEQRQEHGGFRGAMPAKADEPEYSTFELAEEAFFKLLRKHNISPDSTWEDALRVVVKEKEYRSLKDAKDRRAAFERYCIDVRAQEKSKAKERRTKVREDFLRMLTTHDEIDHFTRWKTARPIIEREVVFKSAGDEDERRQLFDEYVLDLKRKHAEDEIAGHRKGLRELQQLLQALITDPDMKWQDARKAITSNERFNSDDTFAHLNQLDVVDAFQNHMTTLGRLTNEAKQKERRLQSRRERQARDGFRQLMQDLRGQGKIKAGTKWSDIQSIIADDERYTSILGNAGSSPLELFWDVVEEEERGLRGLRNDALDVLEDRRYEMTLETTFDDFMEVMRSDKRTSAFAGEQLELVYDRLMAKIKKRADENKVVNERSQRKAIDDLRAAMKHADPPIRASETYEEVSARLQNLEEFRAVDEEGRKDCLRQIHPPPKGERRGPRPRALPPRTRQIRAQRLASSRPRPGPRRPRTSPSHPHP